MYIHFSHYANSPKCIVDTAEIWKTLDVFISISLVNNLSKSNWRNSLFSLVSLWAILLQDIATKWWLLLVPGTVFDFEKRSSRSGQTLTIYSWLIQKMLWKKFLLHVDQALIDSSKVGHVGVFVNYISQHNISQIPQHHRMVTCHD